MGKKNGILVIKQERSFIIEEEEIIYIHTHICTYYWEKVSRKGKMLRIV